MDVELTVQARELTGKGATRSLRKEAKVPAVLYGPKTAPMPLAVSSIRLQKLLRDMGEESKLIQLQIEDSQGKQVRQVLIQEVQTHPVRRQFLHVDFYEVPLDQAIVVDVPVEIVGESIGEKKGGILELIRRTLTVRCLPEQIPERVQIEVADLDIGGSIHVSDLMNRVPFELVEDKHVSVVTVAAPEVATPVPETGKKK
jgi:large subunit ribosomal protein L25